MHPRSLVWRSSGPGRKLVLGGVAPWESRICRSLETSPLNSTPANGGCMWKNEQNVKANRHSAGMCKHLLGLLGVINHTECKSEIQ